MATTYPYVSAQGAIVKAFEQFRKAVPATVDAELLKKFEIAPKNESYVINTLRFLGIIDDEGKRVEDKTGFFFEADEKFASGLEKVLLDAYGQLFSEHGQGAWNESKSSLTSWFRVTDKTSDVVGGRQAQTFLTLAALAGHGEAPPPTKGATKATGGPAKKASNGTKKAAPTPEKKPDAPKVVVPDVNPTLGQPIGLSVRIEVNLPATGTPDVYDSIFASIRKHLIDRD